MISAFPKKKSVYFALGAIFLLIWSLAIIYLSRKDYNFERNWLLFSLWLLNFIAAFGLIILYSSETLLRKISRIIKEDFKILLLLLILAVFTRIILLTKYPFVSVADELRDAGLNAFLIAKGQIKDLFGFGSYGGYGNFIPLISYFFYLFFKNSTLTYILPSALIGVFSILLTYFWARIIEGKKTAVITTIFLIISPYHLHYSRTELLVIMDSLLAPLILIGTIVASKFTEGFLLFGLLYGLAFHFYAGIRGILIISISWLMLGHFVEIFKKRNNFLKIFGKILLSWSFFLVGMIISLGPTLDRLILKHPLSQIGQPQLLIANGEFLQIVTKMPF